MTLRIMLVGLVASLGFELPNGTDVSSWAKAGSAWVQARICDPSGPGVESKLVLDGPADCHQADEHAVEEPVIAQVDEIVAEDAFQVVSEVMLADLQGDLLANQTEKLPVFESGPILAIEEATPVVALEEMTPVVALESEPAGCLILTSDEKANVGDDLAVDFEWIEEVEPAADESPEPLDRVSSALRLTRDAVQAWAELLQ